jgi:chromosome segregation ATPase
MNLYARWSELATSNERGERLLTEVESLGEIRARFEEQLRIMEVQHEENRSETMEKEAFFKEMREEHEMLQAEVIELRAKVKEGRAERTMLEDRLKDSSTDVTKLDRERTRLDQVNSMIRGTMLKNIITDK